MTHVPMPLLKVKKVVAVCFQEAAKTTLEHLGAYRLEFSQMGVDGSPDLPRLYGEVRRLRDYLQRCASAYQDQVELDLTEPDQALLVACCRRSIEAIDVRLSSDQVVASDERQWLERKRQVIADWAVELAARPLLELPLKRLAPVVTEATRALQTRLNGKLFGDIAQRKKFLAPDAGQASQMQGVPSFGIELDESSPLAQPAKPAATAQPGPPPSPAVTTTLLDSNKMRDPRLRSLMAMDLRSYERAVEAGDYRLAAVLLASVLESALLDHLVPRRNEFALTGTPDTWNPQELLLRVMGDSGTPQDRSLAYHLFAARSLLRPALQMITPSVVTVASFERLREFVQRALHCMGFAGGGVVFDVAHVTSPATFPPEG